MRIPTSTLRPCTRFYPTAWRIFNFKCVKYLLTQKVILVAADKTTELEQFKQKGKIVWFNLTRRRR